MVRFLLYIWALPTTLVGLPLAIIALIDGGETRFVAGVLEAHGRAIRFMLRRCTLLKGGASAITFGHVVLGKDGMTLERTREHERVHVRQCEVWGPFFIPAYLVAGLLAWLSGKRAYRDNYFERQAFSKTSQVHPNEP